MTNPLKRQYRLASTALGLVLTAATGLAQYAQDVSVRPSGIQHGGDAGDTGIGNWGAYWITSNALASCTVTFDPTMRSAADIPGSVYIVCDWNGSVPSQDTDINVGATMPNGGSTWLGDPNINVIDGSKYESLSMDIYWTNTTLTTWANIGLMTPSYGMVFLTNNVPISTNAGWQHLVIPIDPSLNNLDSISGFMFYRWGDGPNHAEFWVDNVQLIARAVAIPPPVLGLKKALPGFTMFADSLPSYNRQNLRTGTNANNNVTWLGRPGPVTYLMDVADHPGASHPYMPLHITLVPGLETSSDPDWSAVNCVFLEIANQGDGTATAGLHYKTNSPANNAMLFADGSLGYVDGNSILGTWSLTFNQDTNLTVTTPDGATLQAVLPPEVAALFTDPISVYFGMAVGNDQNLGQSVTFDHLQISGVVNPIDEHFTAATLNTNIWSIHPQDGNFQANVLMPPDAKFWLYWSVPDTGFRPQVSAVLGDPQSWGAVTFSPTLQNGPQRYAAVRQSDLPSADSDFFRLFKPTASRLQVLMPGETNAPGTVTGKIGTPDQQIPGVLFDVVVNAVDDQFNIMTDVSDTIHLTTSDTLANDYLPPDKAMVKGTVTFNQVYFLDFGTWTITATDVTNDKIASDTGSPTESVNP